MSIVKGTKGISYMLRWQILASMKLKSSDWIGILVQSPASVGDVVKRSQTRPVPHFAALRVPGV